MRRFILFIMSFAIGLQAQAMAKETIATIHKDFNVPRLRCDFNDEEISRQMNEYPNELDFHGAAVMALRSFINDYNEEDSPLAVSIEDVGEAAGDKNLHNLLNHSGTKFALVSKDSKFMPKNGEMLDKNWIFYLRIVDMNIKFWAIIDRTGQKKAYNYGKW